MHWIRQSLNLIMKTKTTVPSRSSIDLAALFPDL